jgi:hypothetical protein
VFINYGGFNLHEAVHQNLMDFQNWPAWNKKVTRMRLNGQLTLSGEIPWKRWGVPVVSFIQSVEPTQHIK